MKRGIVVDNVRPRTPTGLPAKGVVGRRLRVSADIFRDGHHVLAARVAWRVAGSKKWQVTPMAAGVNDAWAASLEPTELGLHEFYVEAWTDAFGTWRHDTAAKLHANADVDLELEEGARLLESRTRRLHRVDREHVRYALEALRDPQRPAQERFDAALTPELVGALSELSGSDATKSPVQRVWIDRERAAVGAWYELFPRSYGGLRGATARLDAVAAMGFDVVYLPPVHPIGSSFRKGRDNSLTPDDSDPGSPWAIGNASGGHTAIEPALGDIADFDAFVARADELHLDVALDYALQCSPDHPWVAEHPEWFHQRPDGSIQYAENPPKKYQDIYPINFWPDEESDRRALWDACKEVVDFWIGHGVRIFRVDNPHTKPLTFWEWLIAQVHADHPDIVFLSEAFTRPKMMAKLAEVGFSQSYTYFTWRTSKHELRDYVEELAYGPTVDYMRPNFWPTTPDILSGPLRNGHPGVFKQRLVLAATLSPSYGVYSGYELCENEPFSDGNEEFLHSEKYEIKHRDFDRPDSLAPFLTRLNEIRRHHPALTELDNVTFHHSGNDEMLVYSKATADGSDVVLVVVNLDPHNPQEDTLGLDVWALGVGDRGRYEAHDEITDTTFVWYGANPYVRLSPAEPAHILHIREAHP
ncbi:MAG TPA: alpha-1,4-glucan--maltose-1-phosphate maltosyltransferase [Acidimicrobiales bacterium]|nr:alpha-1,4-glucan--maltose-1-phosphate maltosyltransferase [Acidimicrobiales bacterium]